MTAVTAKVVVSSKNVTDFGTNLAFSPDYANGRNAEWAAATPNLSLSMTVINGVAENFEQGKPWTLTLTPTED